MHSMTQAVTHKCTTLLLYLLLHWQPVVVVAHGGCARNVISFTIDYEACSGTDALSTE